MHICPTTPIPTIDTIMASFLPALTYPPSIPAVPSIALSLLGLPSPLYPTMTMPNIEIVMTSIQLQAFQLQTTMMGMIKPMLNLIGGSLGAFLPSIPGLPGITLVDLLAGDPEKLISAIEAAIASGFSWPFIPNPLYVQLNIPNMEAPQILLLVVSDYMQLVMNSITSLIGEVTSFLEIGNISGLPTFPTLDSVLSMVEDAIGGELTNIQEKLSAISIPGFPSLPMMPDPLIPSFDIPAITLTFCITALYNNLIVGMMTPIMSFIMGTLSHFMSFTFPIMCIDL